MRFKITTLSENAVAGDELLAEWGLSIVIESPQANVLFDCGQSLSASHNADVLGIDLSRIDKVVLSHGHFDHTGGLPHVLRRMGKEVEVVAHPDIWVARYSHSEDSYRYIGIPFVPELLERMGAIFDLSREPVKISENIMTTGEIPQVTEFEEIPPKLVIKEGNAWQPDLFPDDQALIIHTENGLAVILGCAHRGIINTLYHARQLTGIQTVHTVIGGSHLAEASEDRVQRTITILKELGVQRLGLCHCTGERVLSLMSREFGDGFFYNHSGTRFDLDL